jgi:hypothetical protein
MGASYHRILNRALGVLLWVEFVTDGREVTNYSVVLIQERDGLRETIRVYDGAHGYNEMHRYTRGGGKQPGELFHAGTLGEGKRAAIAEVERGYSEMIEGWRRQ